MGKAREHAGTQVNEHTQQPGTYEEHLYVVIGIIILYLLTKFRDKLSLLNILNVANIRYLF